MVPFFDRRCKYGYICYEKCKNKINCIANIIFAQEKKKKRNSY